jgi:hypothetical protein
MAVNSDAQRRAFAPLTALSPGRPVTSVLYVSCSHSGQSVSGQKRPLARRENSSSTPRLTGAGARSAQGTNTGHKDGEAIASVGVRVEPPVSHFALWFGR